MRCIKCGYISFDHNTICPKCNKDLKEVQGRLNLPDFKPAPLSLLGMLIGEGNDSNVNLNVPLPPHLDEIDHDDIILDVSDDLPTGGPELEEEEPGSDFFFDMEETEVSAGADEPEVITELPDMEHDKNAWEDPVMALAADEPLDLDLEGIAFDLEDISNEKGLTEEPADPEEDLIITAEDNIDLVLELDDLTLDEAESQGPIELEKTSPEESEFVTMEIDRNKSALSGDEKDTA